VTDKIKSILLTFTEGGEHSLTEIAKLALRLWAGTVGFLADNQRVRRVQCNRTRRR
jgi:hypothetical protein